MISYITVLNNCYVILFCYTDFDIMKQTIGHLNLHVSTLNYDDNNTNTFHINLKNGLSNIIITCPSTAFRHRIIF